MTINFTMSDEQRKLQYDVRAFAENVLAPVVASADSEPDPLKGFQMTKPAYVEAYRAGIAMCMLPKAYGGGGVSCVDLVIAAEEICVVDPGFACTVLCNGLGLMPVAWYGSDEQKDRFLGAATSDPTGEYLGGWTASEPPGNPSGTANFDIPLPRPAGVGLTAVRDGDDYVVNGRKYWPSSAGWDERGVNAGTLIVRTDGDKGERRVSRRSSSNAIRPGSPTAIWTRSATGSRRTPRSCSTTPASPPRTSYRVQRAMAISSSAETLHGPAPWQRSPRSAWPARRMRWPWIGQRTTRQAD